MRAGLILIFQKDDRSQMNAPPPLLLLTFSYSCSLTVERRLYEVDCKFSSKANSKSLRGILRCQKLAFFAISYIQKAEVFCNFLFEGTSANLVLEPPSHFRPIIFNIHCLKKAGYAYYSLQWRVNKSLVSIYRFGIDIVSSVSMKNISIY